MKTIIIFVVICSVQVYGGISDQLSMNLAAPVGSCAFQHKVTPEQMLALSTLQSPSDKATQCFLACVAKQSGMMETDNSFDRTNVVNTMKSLVEILSVGKGVDSTHIMNSIADACIALPASSDECITAKNAFDCFARTAKTSGL